MPLLPKAAGRSNSSNLRRKKCKLSKQKSKSVRLFDINASHTCDLAVTLMDFRAIEPEFVLVLSAKLFNECYHVLSKQLWLLQCTKVTTLRHFRPLPDIRE